MDYHLILQQLSGHVGAKFKKCYCTSFLKTCQCSSISLQVSYTSNPTTNKHNDGKTQSKDPMNLMSRKTSFCPQKSLELLLSHMMNTFLCVSLDVLPFALKKA